MTHQVQSRSVREGLAEVLREIAGADGLAIAEALLADSRLRITLPGSCGDTYVAQIVSSGKSFTVHCELPERHRGNHEADGPESWHWQWRA